MSGKRDTVGYLRLNTNSKAASYVGAKKGDTSQRRSKENEGLKQDNSFTSMIVDQIRLAPGLKTVLSFSPHRNICQVGLQYRHVYTGINTSLKLSENPIINFSGVIGTKVLSLGTDVSLNATTRNFAKYNFGWKFSTKNVKISMTLNKFDTVAASYYHLLSRMTSTAVGVEITRRLSSGRSTITFGTQHALSPSTIVKARVTVYGKVTTSIQHEWRPKNRFTICGEVDTMAIAKGAKIGMSLDIKV